jgi:hypothetical protein
MEHAKTATQINTESTSGSTMRDNLLERMTIRTLEPMINCMYQMAQTNLGDGDTSFQRNDAGGATKVASVSPEVLKQDGRKVIVTGFHGMMNKQNEISELREALQVMTQGNLLEQMPQLMPVVQETTFKLLGRLGIKNLDKYKADAATLILQSPQGQQMMQQAQQQGFQAGMQAAVQGPQGAINGPAGPPAQPQGIQAPAPTGPGSGAAPPPPGM